MTGMTWPLPRTRKVCCSAVEEKHGQEGEHGQGDEDGEPTPSHGRQHKRQQVDGDVSACADRDARADKHDPHHDVKGELLGPRDRGEKPIAQHDIDEQQQTGKSQRTADKCRLCPAQYAIRADEHAPVSCLRHAPGTRVIAHFAGTWRRIRSRVSVPNFAVYQS